MQRAFLGVRSVGALSLAGLGLILLFFFANDAFAAGDASPLPAQEKARQDVIARSAAASDVGSTSRAVLPLDHGPRATTTPWLNQQRRLKAAAAASAAAEASAVGSGAASLAQH